MISVSLEKTSQDIRISLKELTTVVRFVCRNEKVLNGELSFVIVNDRIIQSINKKYLHHDYTTDVITFQLETTPLHAEIFINAQQVKRQAKEFSVSIKNELIRLIIHGTLHALGYSDTTLSQRKKMFELQEKFVSNFSQD
jgi:probable rRNA maturation factor